MKLSTATLQLSLALGSTKDGTFNSLIMITGKN